MADVDDVTYKLNPYTELDEKCEGILRLAGKVLAKAVFERMPITAHLDIGFIKYMINKDITFEDLNFIDK